MKGLAITSKGIENIAAMEIKELINNDYKIEEGCVIFDFKDFKDLCLLCYKAQSIDRVVYLLDKFEFKSFFEDLKIFIEKLNFDKWLNYKKFKIECIRLGTHNFNSVDVEEKTAELIFKKSKNKIKPDVKDYGVIFLFYIVDNKCYFGVDFAGFELNKRSYKIFLHPNSLRGTIAYALVRESNFKKKDVMLDPFARDGVIAIEAALYANNFPVNYYKKDKFVFLKLKLDIDFDKFLRDIDKKINPTKIKDFRGRENPEDFPLKSKTNIYSYDHLFKYVDFSKKNAKIAGVDKYINFSRVELEWLDIKFKKESVDSIVTNPPSSKNTNLDKIYNEFFYQAEYILKKNGLIALISKMPELIKKHAEKHNFIIAKEKDIWSGQQQLKIMVFKNVKTDKSKAFVVQKISEEFSRN